MTTHFQGRLISSCTAAILVIGGAAAAHAQSVDTSEWVCELCPFDGGYDGDVAAGATGASDDSAYFGDATGYDESGAYGNLDSRGTLSSDAYYLRWDAVDLLLDSRSARVDGGQGRFGYHASYNALPRREYFTTETVFASSDSLLSLPSDWIAAPQTSGFSMLASSLAGIAIEGDRTDLRAGVRYALTPRIVASVDFRRHENEGTRTLGGSSYTTASLLPAPYDYTTDEIELRVAYQGESARVALDWFLSDLSSASSALAWQDPFVVPAGAEMPALAQAPDSRYQQLTLSGGVNMPLFRTSVSASASIGEITQDTPFLAYTTNTTIAADPLPRPNLDGSVDVTHLALSVSSRPLPKANVRLLYRSDERDNTSARATWQRVIVDAFPSGDNELNTPYSYQQQLLSAEAGYRLFSSLKLLGGVSRRETDRDFQEVAEQTQDTGWLGFRWRPWDWLSLDGRGGAEKRDVGRYDETVATSLGQNPLLRKYNLAYRYREFARFTAGITPVDWPITVALNGLYADDSYTESRLGVTEGKETRFTADLNWTISETVSWYVDIGIDTMESRQVGSESFGDPDWSADVEDDFATVGTGIRIRQIADKADLRIDYRESDSASETRIDSLAGGADTFPEFETRQDALHVGVDYRWSERLLLEFGLTWQMFEADDWMLDGVGPATIPSVLSLGATPYDDEQVLFGIGFRYDLAATAAGE